MRSFRQTSRRPSLRIREKRKNASLRFLTEHDIQFGATCGGNLTPDIQLNPTIQPSLNPTVVPKVLQVGRYLLTGESQVGTNPIMKVYRAVNIDTDQQYVCKVLPVHKYREVLSPYGLVGHHPHINNMEDLYIGETEAYAFFSRHYGDLHTYVRCRRRLREAEGSRLFAQIIAAIRHCHANGVLVRDIKLRKFVFRDEARTELMLDNLEDTLILSHGISATSNSLMPEQEMEQEESPDLDDRLTDKHGCPAYVSPEILRLTVDTSTCRPSRSSVAVSLSQQPSLSLLPTGQTTDSPQTSIQQPDQILSTSQQGNQSVTNRSVDQTDRQVLHCAAPVRAGENTTTSYSGRAACMWSLGVLLYTTLVGRYPFHDSDPFALFAKIRRGRYSLPTDGLSPSAKCLVRGLLQTDPALRLTLTDVSRHPWLVTRSHASELIPSAGSTPNDRSSARGAGPAVKSPNCDQTVPEYITTSNSCENDLMFG